MERKMYTLTENQIKKIQRYQVEMPSDDELKAMWAKSHHGKVTGWGMKKAELARQQLKGDVDYQRGIWQGRVDRANNLPYSDERITSSYNMGYHEGYANYESDRRGWDEPTRNQFDEKYVNN